MAAHEGAFTPSEDAAREQRYLRYYGKSMPFFSKMMLALQDNPSDTRAFYKEHLSKASEAASLRKLVTSLPVRDEGEAAKPARNLMRKAWCLVLGRLGVHLIEKAEQTKMAAADSSFSVP